MLRLPELPSQLAFPPSPRPSMQVWDFPITVSLQASSCYPPGLIHYRKLSPKGYHSLAAHHQLTVFQAAHAFTSHHVGFFHMSFCICFSGGLTPCPMGFTLPLGPLRRWLTSTALMSPQVFTAAAARTQSQLRVAGKQPQLPWAGLCTAHILCPAVWQNLSHPLTLLLSATELVKHLGIVK